MVKLHCIPLFPSLLLLFAPIGVNQIVNQILFMLHITSYLIPLIYINRTQMTNFIKEVRASKNGSLTGLSFDDIVACVAKLVKAKERQVNMHNHMYI